jgi:hypothetical protein
MLGLEFLYSVIYAASFSVPYMMSITFQYTLQAAHWDSEPHCHSVKESGTPEAGGVDPGSLKSTFISSIFRPRRGQLQG